MPFILFFNFGKCCKKRTILLLDYASRSSIVLGAVTVLLFDISVIIDLITNRTPGFNEIATGRLSVRKTLIVWSICPLTLRFMKLKENDTAIRIEIGMFRINGTH